MAGGAKMIAVSMSPITELVVPYDPGPLNEKVARRRGRVRSRIISLIITVAILVAIYFWQRDQLQGNSFLVVYGVVRAPEEGWGAALTLGPEPASPATTAKSLRPSSGSAVLTGAALEATGACVDKVRAL